MRGNALANLIATYFGIPSSDVTATAMAEASPSNAATCVAPFVIADRWTERQTPAWDADDTFSAYPTNPSSPPDVYVPADQPGYTGFKAMTHTGLQLTLKAGTGGNISPSFYFALSLPDSRGAADYEWNIPNCNTSLLHWNDLLTAEPGNMVGPTRQGVESLIALDPTAYWDTTTNQVVSTMNPSPRIKIVPVFDPYYYDTGKQNGRTADLKVANLVGFFFERMQGNEVVGRITPVSAALDSSAGPSPAGAFPRTIRLVQ
jgi:hypothetical protein